MQTRDPDTRTVPPIDTRKQWNTLIESVETEGDAIVESESGARAVLISYTEFQEIREERKKRRVAEAYAQLQAAMQEQEKLNEALSEEEAERIAQEFSREFYEELAERGVINVRRTGKA